jgi:hypothetical protein
MNDRDKMEVELRMAGSDIDALTGQMLTNDWGMVDGHWKADMLLCAMVRALGAIAGVPVEKFVATFEEMEKWYE